MVFEGVMFLYIQMVTNRELKDMYRKHVTFYVNLFIHFGLNQLNGSLYLACTTNVG